MTRKEVAKRLREIAGYIEGNTISDCFNDFYLYKVEICGRAKKKKPWCTAYMVYGGNDEGFLDVE